MHVFILVLGFQDPSMTFM